MAYSTFTGSLSGGPGVGRLLRAARIFGVVALMHVAMGSVAVGLPLLAIALGASSFDLGLIGAIPTITYVLLAFACGRLSDRWGRAAMVRLAPFLYASAVLAATMSRTWQVLIPITMGTALTMAMLWPAYMALIAEAAPRGALARQIAAFNLAWACGLVIGNSLGGALAGRSHAAPFYLAAGLAVVAGVVVASPRVGNGAAAAPRPDELPDGSAPVSAAQVWRLLIICWCAMFASVFGVALVRMLFPKLALELGFTPGVIGLLVAALTAAQAVTFVIVGLTQWWRYRLAPLLIAQVAAVGAYAVVALSAHAALFAVAFLVIGFANGLAYAAAYYYSINRPLRRGTFAGIHESIIGGGAGLGPLFGGLAARDIGPRAPYLLCAAVIIAAIVAQIALRALARDPPTT